MSASDLRISVTFLTSRYHGEEWPPSPAKLFQALVAATYGSSFQPKEEAALLWLEQQAPPQVTVCDSRQEPSYRIAVPNNDMDVVAREWAAGRYADPARLRTMKDISPKLMLESGPHVQYLWNLSNPGAERLKQIRNVVHRLHTFGWGIDMAYADCAGEIKDGDVYEPSATGLRLPVPMPETLNDLRAAYRRFTERSSSSGVDTHTRPAMLRLQAYREKGAYAPPWRSFVLLQADSDLTRSVPWHQCMTVAGWLRHACAETLRGEYGEDFINEYVLGHSPGAQAVRRLSYVPLPSLHSKHSDGMIRRVALVEPPDSDGVVTSLLAFKLTGALLVGRDRKEECVLAPSGQDDWVMGQYTRGSHAWRSVTPVILHGHNLHRHGAISINKTERLLLRAFEMAGIAPEQVSSLAFQGAPLWPGARHASAMFVPDHLQRYPRLHVEVRFKKEIRGPVLAGIGRHYGVGLFASSKE